MLGRLRSRLGLGKNGANSIEQARELHSAGDLDGAVAFLKEACARPPQPPGDPEALLNHQQARLLLAEYIAETGIRDGDPGLARAGIQKLVALPTMNVNALRQGVIHWPEKLTRAEEFLGALLAPTWGPGTDKHVFLPELVSLASAWNLLLEPASARRVCQTGFASLRGDDPGLFIVLAEAEFGLGDAHRALQCLASAFRTGAILESDTLAVALLGSIQRGEDRELAGRADALAAELHCLQGRWNQGLPMLQRTLEKQGDAAETDSILALLTACARSRHVQEYEAAAELLLRRELTDAARDRVLRELQDLVVKNTDRPRLRGFLAILRHRSGQRREAYADLTSILAGSPLPSLTLQLSQCLLPASVQSAEVRLSQTLELAHALFEAGSHEACAQLLAGFENAELSEAPLTDAAALAAQTLTSAPDSNAARTAVCQLLLRQGRIPEAIAAGQGLREEAANASVRKALAEAAARLAATQPPPPPPPPPAPPPPPIAPQAGPVPMHGAASHHNDPPAAVVAPGNNPKTTRPESTEPGSSPGEKPGDNLDTALERWRTGSPDMEACAVYSTDGFILASRLSQGLDEERLAAASACLITAAEQTGRELGRGHIDQIHIRGSEGLMVLVAAGEAAYLVGLFRRNATLGVILVGMNRTAQEVARLI